MYFYKMIRIPLSMFHVKLLEVVENLPFSLSKNDLILFLKGETNDLLSESGLTNDKNFGCLVSLRKDEIIRLVDFCVKNYLIEVKGDKVLLTARGFGEIASKNLRFDVKSKKNLYSEEEERLFASLDFFFGNFNKPQKKAVISSASNILCVAGPGTGKTTVLVKRVEFLVKFRGVDPSKILVITFTRKARKVVMDRLEIEEVNVETFNSFSEKVLRRYNKGKVISFEEKLEFLKEGMKELQLDLNDFKQLFFSRKQIEGLSESEVFARFAQEVFGLIDYMKNTESGLFEFYQNLSGKEKWFGKKVYNLILFLEDKIKSLGLRDFSDQVIETVKLFKENLSLVPNFEHVLVDEFQDVNSVQFELLKLINPKNLFAVGDPRQAIFSWRGASDKFIKEFTSYFRDGEVIYLYENYRSCRRIIDVSNILIRSLGMPDISASESEEGEVYLGSFDSIEEELRFIADKTRELEGTIFVLARTNRLLDEVADFLRREGIEFEIKREESEVVQKSIILSTVHSIKGLEADNVFLVEVSNLYYPNQVRDSFVQEAVKSFCYYDREREELRLLYVGFTRAKERLFVLHSGQVSKFISSEVEVFMERVNRFFDIPTSVAAKRNLLRDLRRKVANILDVPVYEILSNDELEQLLSLRPRSKEELLEIGINSFFVTKFGDEIIKILDS